MLTSTLTMALSFSALPMANLDEVVLVQVDPRVRDDARHRAELSEFAVDRASAELSGSGVSVARRADAARADTLRRHLESWGGRDSIDDTRLHCALVGADFVLSVAVRVVAEQTRQGRRTVNDRLRLRLEDVHGRTLFDETLDTQGRSVLDSYSELHRSAIEQVLGQPEGGSLSKLRSLLVRRREVDEARGPLYRLTLLGAPSELRASHLREIPGLDPDQVEWMEDGAGVSVLLRFGEGRGTLESRLEEALNPAGSATRLRIFGHGRQLFLRWSAGVEPVPRDETQTVSLRDELGAGMRRLAGEAYQQDPDWFLQRPVRFVPGPVEDSAGQLRALREQLKDETELARPGGAESLPTVWADGLGAYFETDLGGAAASLSESARLRIEELSEGRLRATSSRPADFLLMLRDEAGWFGEESVVDAGLLEALRSDGARRLVWTGLEPVVDGWRLRLNVVDLETGWQESLSQGVERPWSDRLDDLRERR